MGCGKQLKAILAAKKMTIKQLSDKSKIPYSTLQSIISRDSNPRFEIIYAIAEALEIEPYELSPYSSNASLSRAYSDSKKSLDQQIANCFERENSSAAARANNPNSFNISKYFSNSPEIYALNFDDQFQKIANDYVQLHANNKIIAVNLIHSLLETQNNGGKDEDTDCN